MNKPLESKVVISGWFGFWMFMTVYIICESVMYMHGHETFFWKHKTAEEKHIQQQQILILENSK
jgi:hypothetical protein